MVRRIDPGGRRVCETHARRTQKHNYLRRPVQVPPSARALGAGGNPISKNLRSTGVAPRGQNVALGKEKRSRWSEDV